MIPKLFTVEDAAPMLGLSRAAVYEEIAAGHLEVYRLGPNRGALRISEAGILAYLEARRCAVVADSERAPAPPVATGAPTLRPVPKPASQADLNLIELAERGKRVKRSARGQ